MLHAEAHGPPDAPPVVLVHGFTQTRRSWRPLLPRLTRSHRVLTVDAPAHGRSAAVRTDLVGGGRLLGETGGEAAYVGYSMGGRMTLHLALARPDLVRRLVLVGATAGLETDQERTERRAADEALAAGLERDGLDPFLERWLANALFATLPADAAALEDRRENTAEGLADSLRRTGTGTQEPLWDRLPTLRMPALLVAGAHDAKFTALARRMAAAWGGSAEVAIVPDAGHACHLEQPEAFLDLVEPFLLDGGGAGHRTARPADSNSP